MNIFKGFSRITVEKRRFFEIIWYNVYLWDVAKVHEVNVEIRLAHVISASIEQRVQVLSPLLFFSLSLSQSLSRLCSTCVADMKDIAGLVKLGRETRNVMGKTVNVLLSTSTSFLVSYCRAVYNSHTHTF